MKKYIFLVLLLSFNSLSLAQEPLKAGVSKTWTVDTAREEAFKDAATHIDISAIPSIDPNLIENKSAINSGGGQSGDRTITVFQDGTYCVHEINSPYAYYYALNGRLNTFDICIDQAYPAKSYKYIAYTLPGAYNSGDLLSVGIDVAPRETYMFLATGELTAHWVGPKCYNPNGSSCGTRRAYQN